MKRVTVLIAVMCGLGVAPACAQRPMQISGYGGFGLGFTGYQSGGIPAANWTDMTSELGLNASGFVYDPRLLNYTLDADWDGNNTGIDQVNSRSDGLNYFGSFSFLSGRPYTFSIFFSREHQHTSGELISPFSTVNTLWGLRGEIKKPSLAMISYDFGFGKTSSYLPTQPLFNTRQRFADVTAARKAAGWDFRLGDNYLRTASTFTNFVDEMNTFGADASRRFGDRIFVDLSAMQANFNTKELNGVNPSSSNVTVLNGIMTWKHTAKLDSYYNFNVARNAVNALQLVLAVNGDPSPSGALGLQSLASKSETAGAGLNFRPLSSLSLSGGLAYSNNGLPQQTLQTLSSSEQSAIATSELGTTFGVSYNHKVWKLHYTSSNSVNWQHYRLLGGLTDSAVGYSLDNGFSGGNARQVRFSASYRYSSQSNPFFFNVVNSHDEHGTLRLDSEHFRWVKLAALADVGSTRLNLAGNNIKLDTSSYMLSATFKKVSLYASDGLSNSAEAIFGPGSVLLQPGGSTGGVEIPTSLLTPSIFSTVKSERIGIILPLRRNLEIESRYSFDHLLFNYQNSVWNSFHQFDTTANYMFGRFTVLAGYGIADSGAATFHEHVDRLFVRFRFPFKLF